nr:retrovirus-related Pol polyprotein from transposon TNT 1-94 [Tanacetum cinerariifolium]
LHMDLCGPMRIASINGKRYVLVIVDDYSRYTLVHFLRSKDEALDVIIKFLKRITVLLQSPVIIIRTDNGTEFKNQVLKVYFESVGISYQMSSVRTPQQNGVVERRNRTLVEASRTMLIFSCAPLFLWAEAIATACLPKFKYHKEHLCPSCEQGKNKRASHPPKPVPNSRQRLHLLHMDLCGPIRIASINEKRYILVIVDDYSRYTWIHFLRSKDEAPAVIITFLKRITVLLQSPVIIIRIDNDTEFKNQVLKVYFDSVGISHQMSSVRTPQQNGGVERRNQTLVEAARTMLIFSRAPLFLWAEATATACFTQNRSIIHRRFNKTPYELINGRKPDISFLHVFSALCYPKNDRKDIGKLGAKGDIGFFIGYSADSCAYRIYICRTKKIMETINVSFDELSAMAFEQSRTVRFENDHVAAILGLGDLQWGNILITRVYFVEGLGHNLFSVGQFCDSDLEVAFRRNACFIRNLEGVDLLKGDRSTNLYTINLHEMASAFPICLMARASSTKSWLWHQRLSHLNFDTINDLARNDIVASLPKFKYHKEHLCPSCEQGKSKRASHPPKPVPNSR